MAHTAITFSLTLALSQRERGRPYMKRIDVDATPSLPIHRDLGKGPGDGASK
jgi:hypothetical protein